MVSHLLRQYRKKAGFFLVRSCINKNVPPRQTKQIPVFAMGLLVVCFLVAGYFILREEITKTRIVGVILIMIGIVLVGYSS